MLLIAGLSALLVAMTLWGETATGRWLRAALVDPVARRLNRVRAGQAVGVAVLTVVAAAAFLLFEVEGLRLIGLAAPEVIGWFALFDVAVFVEAMVAASALAASRGLKGLRDRVGLLTRVAARSVLRLRRMARGVRARRVTGPRRPRRLDDPDPSAWTYAPA